MLHKESHATNAKNVRSGVPSGGCSDRLTGDLADLSKGRRVSKQRLKQEKRWSQLLTQTPPIPEGFVELGELCRVHRGAVTGANATWITTANDPQLPARTLFPTVTKARELFDADDGLLSSLRSLRAVIDLPADLSELDDDDRALVKRFLRYAERNGAHGIYPRDPLSDDALDTLAASLRSGVSVSQGRTYAGGLTKFEPSEMERIPVPSPILLAEMSS